MLRAPQYTKVVGDLSMPIEERDSDSLQRMNVQIEKAMAIKLKFDLICRTRLCKKI
jgi:hypothetical protein